MWLGTGFKEEQQPNSTSKINKEISLKNTQG